MPNIVIEDAFGYEFVAGPDIFRMANDLDTETNFFKAKLTYYQNNHKITAGFENTVYDTYNVFIVMKTVHLNLMILQLFKLVKLHHIQHLVQKLEMLMMQLQILNMNFHQCT